MTVLWIYAPGYVGEARFEPDRMARLTGFAFREVPEAGPLMIETPGDIVPGVRAFGVAKRESLRFAVSADPAVEVLGRWAGRDEVAFARRRHDGFTSVYCGAAPVPAEVLRRLAADAGVRLWSSKPDVVRATHDAAMLVASDAGERTLTFPAPHAPMDGGDAAPEHRLTLDRGEVRVFLRAAAAAAPVAPPPDKSLPE
jgi:hypothetical protein